MVELARARRQQISRTLWTEAAAELGADVADLSPTRLEIRRGAATTRVTGQTVALNDPQAVARAEDKPRVYELLAGAGVPVPEYLAFRLREMAGACAFAGRRPLPCVVKPARGSGGDGVTGGVRTLRDLRRAALSASRYAQRLLVERQATGDVFRLLVLDDDVLDVVRRRPPAVTGDGRSTVEELMFREDDRRLRGDADPGLKAFAVDLDCLLTLEQQGLSLRSVPRDGATTQVKTVTNYNRSSDNESVRSAVSEAFRADAVAAARAAGLRLAAVDVVSRSVGGALADGLRVVVDLNPIPALHHHLHVANPSVTSRVAVPILRALLDDVRS